jgi:hypothetical protein
VASAHLGDQRRRRLPLPVQADSDRRAAGHELETGTRVAEDIVATNGLVLIGRGVVVTELVLDRLTNYARTIEII